MRRSFIRATVLATCALVATGCATDSMDFDNGSSQKQATAAPSSSVVADLAGQPGDLDGQIRRAQLMRVGGDVKGAIHVLSQLMLVAPDDPRVVGEYGKALAQEGRPSDALAFLGRAVELQPDNWSFYSAQGVAYDQLEERGRAENAYKHALALKPEDPVVLNNYAMSQMMAGNLDKAEDLLNRAASHGGNYPKIANNLAMVSAMRAKRMGPESSAKTPASNIAKAKTPAKKPVSVAKKDIVPKAPSTEVAQNSVKNDVKTAANGPHQLAHPTAQAKKPAQRVVMQKVPYDPLAGKVYGKHSDTKLAKKDSGKKVAKKDDKKPQHVAEAKTDDKAPALRTAADLY